MNQLRGPHGDDGQRPTASPSPSATATLPDRPPVSPPGRPPQVDAGPGRTSINDKVVEKIAARAVDEVARAGGVARRVLGVRLGRDSVEQSAQVTAEVDGELASVRVSMSVVWPTSARSTARTVRDHVISRVRDLTGLEVAQVDIDIIALVAPGQDARRVR